MDITSIVSSWANKAQANIHELRSLLEKLLHFTQCYPLAQFFINRMQYTLRECPVEGAIHLDSGFQKDVNWFLAYLPRTNSIYMMPQDNREPVKLLVGVCAFRAGALCH